jgi:peptide/nickel transport system substrate-binding protein/oligopeptide transport system substrate-binding protein
MPLAMEWNDLLGREIGGYRLESLLGGDDTHAVFRGKWPEGVPPVPGLPQQPALALYTVSESLSPEAQASARSRFVSETQALIQVRQQNLLSIFASGEDATSGLLYLVIPYLGGGSLVARLARGPQPLATASQWVAQLAGALDYLHARGVIHRHIIPSAVLLDLRDTLYLGDAGLAGLVDALRGAPPAPTPYTAPEVARFESVGPAADVYSAAALLYHVVTGQPPAPVAPMPANQLRPDLPPLAAAAITRALASDPAARFPSAGALSQAFTSALQSAGALSAQPIAPAPAAPPPPVVAPPPVAAPPPLSFTPGGASAPAAAPNIPPPPPQYIPPPPPQYIPPPPVNAGGFPAPDGRVVAPSAATPVPPYFTPTPIPPITSPQKRGGGFMTIVLVGLLAALIVALGGGGLYYYTHLRTTGSGAHSGGSSSGDQAVATATLDIASDSQQILRLQAAGVSDVRTLDPPASTDVYSVEYTSIIFPGLVVLDKNLTAIPWAASALPTVSTDGLTWTFHIRPNLKWSDGTPIDANTYAFSMNRAENPCNAFGSAYYLYAIKDAATFNSEQCDTATNKVQGSIQTLIGDSIVPEDPLTLQVTLASPATYFLYAMTYPTSFAVPEQLVNQYGNKYIEHLADNGGFGGDMFKVTQWNHVGDLILTRNDSFWGTKSHLREVDVAFFKDGSTAYNTFLAGQADVGVAPSSQLSTAKTHKTFHQIAVQQIDYYAMNWHDAPFNDVRMRQAFAIALDKTTLANTILHGTVQATNHIVPSGMPGYNPALLGPDGTQNLSGNTQKANQLATAYAAAKGCGTATDFSRCPRVTLTIISGSQENQNEAAAAQQMWLKAMPNYPITITAVDFNTLLQRTFAHQLQFWELGWIEDYPDPQDWLTTNLACDSAYNAGFACDTQADGLMKAADTNSDQTSRLQEYQQAEQLLVTDVAWLPLDQATTWWETGPKLEGFTITAGGLIPRESWQTMYIKG